jgi:hypothetical protein
MTDNLKEYLIILLQLITILGIVFSAIKIVNRNIAEWQMKEVRMQAIERELSELRSAHLAIAALSTKLTDIVAEIERLRTRLDRFLDMQMK